MAADTDLCGTTSHIRMQDIAHRDAWDLPPALYALSNARGLYNPMHCVVRIRPDLQELLRELPAGVHHARNLTPKTVLAYSTQLHETIHWWQHVGSTIGLLLSLSYPMQAHLNHQYLKESLRAFGPAKPLRRYHLDTDHGDEEGRLLNRILNNWHDIEFARRLLLRPTEFAELAKDRYFESIGHALEFTWASLLWLLGATCDREFAVLPDPRKWESAFDELRAKRVEGFYYGSPATLAPVGAYDLFEGQARMSQLQFLHYASAGAQDWSDFRAMGMLDEQYFRAFRTFLEFSETSWPGSIDDPIIGLFLLVVDLALNPFEGFPINVRSPSTFLSDVDPGTRFVMMARQVHMRPEFKTAIQHHSKSEYEEVTNALSATFLWPSPTKVAKHLAKWETSPGIAELIAQDNTFQFSDANLPVRVFAGRFLAYQRDKSVCPEALVWPGAWASLAPQSAAAVTEQHIQTVMRNAPLFVDAPNGEVRPTLLAGRSEQDVYSTFNRFFSWNASYDLIRQWTVEEGPFDFDFRWITPKAEPREFENWCSNTFEELFGIRPSNFWILP